jgi:hypothetical protein
METNITAMIANGAELPQAGAATDVEALLNPRESDAPVAADPIPAPSADEPSMELRQEAPPTTSSTSAPEAVSAHPVTSECKACVAKPVVRIMGIKEICRSMDLTTITSWEPPFEVEKDLEDSFTEIRERAALVLTPVRATPAPTGVTMYGTTEELFRRLQNAIVAQTFQSEHASALLTYWVISTWYTDGLSLAPALALVGPPYESDLVLRALRNFSRNPLMMAGINFTNLKNVNWYFPPTLLSYSPHITKQMASLVGCSTRRNYMFGGAFNYQDFFCAKGLYLGEEVSADRMPRCSVEINVHPTATSSATQKASRLAELEVQRLQNQLLGYRTKNLVQVYNSDFDASALTSDTRAVANALGSCIIDSPALQAQLISLLAPVENQRQADRSTGIDAVIFEATLNLCHQSRPHFLVGQVATEANDIAKARGERLLYSAEMVGHHLKNHGLVTRRISKAGKGLIMDAVTIKRLHELATAYGGAGLDLGENNKHCPLCAENKSLM